MSIVELALVLFLLRAIIPGYTALAALCDRVQLALPRFFLVVQFGIDWRLMSYELLCYQVALGF